MRPISTNRGVLDDIRSIEALIGARPNGDRGIDFTNGGGYIRHDRDMVIAAWKLLTNALDRWHGPINDNQAFSDIPFESRDSFGRYLDDGDSPFYATYMRFICMEIHWTGISPKERNTVIREWGQPYFARNPKEYVTCLEDRTDRLDLRGQLRPSRAARPVRARAQKKSSAFGEIGNRKIS